MILTGCPQKHRVYGKYPGDDFRYWYRSLIKKKPKETDVFRAKSFLMNYDESTGKTLPYMKVELAGRSSSEYRTETRKHLNIQWVDESKMETIVLVDRSLSMDNTFIEIISKSGVALPFLIKSNAELNENYFVPAKVIVGVSAEDGSPLTGNMVFENKTIPLNDWYSENFESFEYGVDFLPEFFDSRTF